MKKISVLWIILIQWALSIEWLHSGWGKWSDPGFINNIDKTLNGFAAKTPYISYGTFLRNSVIPNAHMFGNLIRSSEVLIGLAFLLSGLMLVNRKMLPQWASIAVVIAALGGALMNLNFFLASGWSSPSTWGVNLIMCLIQIVLGLFYLKNYRELVK